MLPGNTVRQNDGFALPAGNWGTLAVMVGKVEYTDIAAKTLFNLPAGAVPVFWQVDVVTDFDAGTNNNLDLGFGSDADYFADDLAIGTAGFYPIGTSGTVNGRTGVQLGLNEDENAITALYQPSGTASSQGEANVTMYYIVAGEDYEVQ